MKYLVWFLLAPLSVAAQPAELTPHWLALSVSDAQTTADWYEKHLGFKETQRMDLSAKGMLIIFVERDGFQLEIAQRSDSVSPMEGLAVRKKSQVRGLYKFGFMVKDLEGLAATLRKDGVSFYGDMFDDPRFGVKTAIILDPEGNMVQLFQKTGK